MTSSLNSVLSHYKTTGDCFIVCTLPLVIKKYEEQEGPKSVVKLQNQQCQFYCVWCQQTVTPPPVKPVRLVNTLLRCATTPRCPRISRSCGHCRLPTCTCRNTQLMPPKPSPVRSSSARVQTPYFSPTTPPGTQPTVLNMSVST